MHLYKHMTFGYYSKYPQNSPSKKMNSEFYSSCKNQINSMPCWGLSILQNIIVITCWDWDIISAVCETFEYGVWGLGGRDANDLCVWICHKSSQHRPHALETSYYLCHRHYYRPCQDPPTAQFISPNRSMTCSLFTYYFTKIMFLRFHIPYANEYHINNYPEYLHPITSPCQHPVPHTPPSSVVITSGPCKKS